MNIIHVLFRQWQPTDTQLIEQARRGLWWRPRVGIVFLIFGAILVFMSFQLLGLFQKDSEEMFKYVVRDSPAEQREFEDEAGQAYGESSRVVGFFVGFAIGGAMAGAISMLVTGFLWTFTRDRKTEMLLMLWDSAELSEAASPDVGTQADGYDAPWLN